MITDYYSDYEVINNPAIRIEELLPRSDSPWIQGTRQVGPILMFRHSPTHPVHHDGLGHTVYRNAALCRLSKRIHRHMTGRHSF